MGGIKGSKKNPAPSLTKKGPGVRGERLKGLAVHVAVICERGHTRGHSTAASRSV